MRCRPIFDSPAEFRTGGRTVWIYLMVPSGRRMMRNHARNRAFPQRFAKAVLKFYLIVGMNAPKRLAVGGRAGAGLKSEDSKVSLGPNKHFRAEPTFQASFRCGSNVWPSADMLAATALHRLLMFFPRANGGDSGRRDFGQINDRSMYLH